MGGVRRVNNGEEEYYESSGRLILIMVTVRRNCIAGSSKHWSSERVCGKIYNCRTFSSSSKESKTKKTKKKTN